MRTILLLLLSVIATALPCKGAGLPKTDRTDALIKELLTKLDSTDVYASIREKRIEEVMAGLPGDSFQETFGLYYKISRMYSKYIVDSALVYMGKAIQISRNAGCDSLRIKAEIARANILSDAGFYKESHEILLSVDRKLLRGALLVSYYEAWSSLYHYLYYGPYEPEDFRERYRAKYNIYKDSLLSVADTLSQLYLHNMERTAARAKDFDKARYYNNLRFSLIQDKRSGSYATCLYDRFAISYIYERELTGEAIDDLLESAIIEVEHCNKNISSLLRVETILLNLNEVYAAKKVSDYYYSSLLKYGSRRRLIEGVEQTIKINNRSNQTLRRRENQIKIALVLISLLSIVLMLTIIKINRTKRKMTRLRDDLLRSVKVSKGYVGEFVQLYSSYIKRLDIFRTKIHSTLKKGNIEQALDLTIPSGDIAAEERKELFRNFDKAFVDIYPDFIQTVNGCLKPETRIVPKKTEILNTELRILALIKLGIEDSTEIAEVLHCSVKTVYNLRSVLNTRLAVSEKEFKSRISEL